MRGHEGSSPRVRGKQGADFVDSHEARLIPACAGKTPSSASASAYSTAHPRVCGENRDSPRRADRRGGSSPRVRGKLHHSAPQVRRRGLIPACAGKTCEKSNIIPPRAAHPRVCGENLSRSPTTPGSTAHPRVCGENQVGGGHQSDPIGSSPRVRGKPRDHRQRPPQPGLIPACAGKTTCGRDRGQSDRAHPRVCGENRTRGVWTADFQGSSPRVRGKHELLRGLGHRCRLIPACAGKTLPSKRGRIEATAHPRVCGENEDGPGFGAGGGGSSPRVRGKRSRGRGRRWSRRLIPACAGKTVGGKKKGRREAAHPRVCGENLGDLIDRAATVGSSPRVRGKQHPAGAGRRRRRLIPACAGKTGEHVHWCNSKGAHPRVCGENVNAISGGTKETGSSPRVRGKPWRPLPRSPG